MHLAEEARQYMADEERRITVLEFHADPKPEPDDDDDEELEEAA